MSTYELWAGLRADGVLVTILSTPDNPKKLRTSCSILVLSSDDCLLLDILQDKIFSDQELNRLVTKRIKGKE